MSLQSVKDIVVIFIIFFDVNDFKIINDILGNYYIGDDVLRKYQTL